MSTHGAKLALQTLHAARCPPEVRCRCHLYYLAPIHTDSHQSAGRVPPTPSPARSTLAERPSQQVRESSPTRISDPKPSSEEASEITEAFPVIEETVAAPAAEPSAPVATRGRRRSASFRAGTSWAFHEF